MKYLFIGGSKDGQWVDVPEGWDTLKVPIPETCSGMYYSYLESVMRPSDTFHVEFYNIRTFAYGETNLVDNRFIGVVEKVFVIESMSQTEAFHHVFACFGLAKPTQQEIK